MEFLDKFMETSVGEKVEYKCNTKENVIEIIIEDKKKDNSERIRVELDVLGYREKRKKALESLAEKIAKSVIRTRKSITLEPMTPYERKIIHSKLQNSNKVKTTSIGEGMHRKVVVSLK